MRSLAQRHFSEAACTLIQLSWARFQRLMGALIGGSTSLVAAIYTQRHQDRLQRVASEVAKRETVYADFVMSASNLVLKAYTHDEIVLNEDERRLIGLMNRMRLFAPPDVVGGAEAVLSV